MLKRDAASYFTTLSQLLLRTQVTDRHGAALSLDEGIERAVGLMLAVRSTSGKAMLIGNGGSAAIASHMQNDLCNTLDIRAIVFNEAALLTALSNDRGYGCVFERPVELWGNPGDLLLAISSSGQSESILRAVRASAARGCRTITFSGFRAENPLRQMGDLNFYVAAQAYGYAEVAHTALMHLLTDQAGASGAESGGLPD